MAQSLEELKSVIKKLEGVYKTTSSQKQKERVWHHMAEIKKIVERMEASGELTDSDMDVVVEINDSLQEDSAGATVSWSSSPAPHRGEEAETADEPEAPKANVPGKPVGSGFQVIATIKINPVHALCQNDDVNFLASILVECENEYWVALSDNHLDLDYNHANKRNTFFTKMENTLRLLKEYLKILEQMEHTARNEFKAQLQSMAVKQERNFIIETVNFLYSLEEFLGTLIADNESHGNIILNPDDKIEFNVKLYGEKKLNGVTVIDAVRRSYALVAETLEYMNLPNLGQK